MTDISIIVPIYNAEKYLSKCINSLINQTKKEIEIILINDGSTDNSEEIINNYRDERIKYFKNENQGIGKTRNFGIEKATGKYLIFVDSDDYLKEDTCEILFKKAEKDKLDLVICNYYKVDEETNKQKKIEIKEFKDTKLKDNKELLLNVNLAPWNKLYRRDLIEKNKIRFVENLKYEDAPFVIEAMDKAKKIGQVTNALNYYVIHKNSETTIRDKKIFDIIKIVDIIRKYFSKRKNFTEVINKLSVRILTNYTIQQRMQQDKKIAKEFINKAFQYMQENIPDYKDNKYYENRGIIRKKIEKSKLLSKIYCMSYQWLKNKSISFYLVSIFSILFIFLSTYTLFNCIFNNHNEIIQIKPLTLLLSSIAYFLMGYLLYKFMKYKQKKNGFIVLIAGVLFLLLQLIFAYIFVVNAPADGWDFGAVHTAAITDVLGGTKITDEWYFYRYSNNLGLAIVLKNFYSIAHFLGIEHYIFLGIVLNIIFIDIAVIYLYKILKLTFPKITSSFFILLTLTFTPLITYVPIFYTDTISLPFGIGAIYYVLSYIKNERKSIFSLVIAGLLLGIGSCIKFTVIIILIAIYIYYFLRESKYALKDTLKQLTIITVFAMIPIISLSAYKNSMMDEERLNKESFPFVHWIMMGLTNTGGYYHPDVEYTGKFSSVELKKEKDTERLIERFKEHIDNHDLITFYNKKIVYTWGDGTFFAPQKLMRAPKKQSSIKGYIIEDGTNHNKIYEIFAQTQWMLVLAFIIIGTILRKYLNLEQRNLQLLLNISIIGIFFFLILWEARSRYLVNFIPLLLLDSFLGIYAIIIWIKKSEIVKTIGLRYNDYRKTK